MEKLTTMGEFIGFSFILLMLLAAYWSFVILPRQRLFRKHNQYVRTLAVGDEVITAGGLVGTITRMEADRGIAHIQVSEGVEVRVLTAALSRPFDPEEVAVNAQLGVDPTADQKVESRV
jgi:preprotein translocase subunit YajC